MYFPDEFAGPTALSERVHRFVLRWAHRHRAKRPGSASRDALSPCWSASARSRGAKRSPTYGESARLPVPRDAALGHDVAVRTARRAGTRARRGSGGRRSRVACKKAARLGSRRLDPASSSSGSCGSIIPLVARPRTAGQGLSKPVAPSRRSAPRRPPRSAGPRRACRSQRPGPSRPLRPRRRRSPRAARHRRSWPRSSSFHPRPSR